MMNNAGLSEMAEKNSIKRLRRAIPKMKGCPEGCAECCGPVPFSRWEWGHLKDKRPLLDGLSCPYACRGKCAIYAERPIICRVFGPSWFPAHLHCGNSSIAFLAPENAAKQSKTCLGVIDEYMRILDKTGVYGPMQGLVGDNVDAHKVVEGIAKMLRGRDEWV
jgi:hypothetical protein